MELDTVGRQFEPYRRRWRLPPWALVPAPIGVAGSVRLKQPVAAAAGRSTLDIPPIRRTEESAAASWVDSAKAGASMIAGATSANQNGAPIVMQRRQRHFPRPRLASFCAVLRSTLSLDAFLASSA